MSSWAAGFPVKRMLRAAAVLPLGAAGLVVQAGIGAPTAQAATSATFGYTGTEQTYTVPTGTTAVTITAVGAPGSAGTAGAAGRDGAKVTATVPLAAGTATLYVEVGGPGAPFVNAFNGGGAGDSGGSGGGASDVRLDLAAIPLSTTDSRLVVAGGGGGGGGGGCAGTGGTAGDTSVTGAGNGGAGAECTATPGGNGGLGGGGGLGGSGAPGGYPPGSNGSLGQGGNAAMSEDFAGGGAGGGGYYGGGAGGDGVLGGGGGGGGSSFWVSAATGTSMSEDTTGTPEVTITPVPAWPASVTGTPRPAAHSAQGYYLGASGNRWTLKATQPGTAKTTFTGTVTVNAGHVSNVSPIALEPGDSYTGSSTTLTFQFSDYNGIDGLRFTIPAAATSITFTLQIGGTPATTSQIYLGSAQTQASTGSPLTFTR